MASTTINVPTGEPSQIPRSSTTNTYLRQDTIDPSNENQTVAKVWKERNLLSLDGGGIRGVWSLLALEMLMVDIGHEETKFEEKEASKRAEHSFHPGAFPDNVSPGPFSDEPLTKEYEHDYKTWKSSRKYLPCHYFDVVCGSSTGALIAIMLGRLRMSVADCLHEYESLGGKVFGKPNFLNELSFFYIPRVRRTKYDSDLLRKVLEDVANRREEHSKSLSNDEPQMYSERRGICGTCVIASENKHEKGGTISEEIIISSYDSTKRTKDANLLHMRRRESDTSFFSPRNITQHGSTSEPFAGENIKWPIWRVAQAATAAPFYFDPVRSKKKNVTYTDGGLQESNNPTKKGVNEIKQLYGPSSVGIVVSVGTARGETHTKSRIKRKLKGMFGAASDPEKIHAWATEKLPRAQTSYYRLNNPGDLRLELDDWRPRGLFTKNGNSGSQTLVEIRNSFYTWVGKTEGVRAIFRRCAEELVQRRRARIRDESKWEHYATGIQFDCPETECDAHPFIDRDKFIEHIQDIHGRENFFQKEDERTKIQRCSKSWQYQRPRRASSG